MSSKGQDPTAMAGADMSDAGGASSSDTGADTTAAGDETGEDSSTTLLCVKMTSDGKFSLVEGDGDDDADDAVSSPDAGVAPEGQTFDAIGPLLKAIAELLKNAQSSDGGTDDANFDAGFAGKGQPSES